MLTAGWSCCESGAAVQSPQLLLGQVGLLVVTLLLPLVLSWVVCALVHMGRLSTA
jgi:hypothetical protein